jgi:predicted protein tyrosine phosphatase
MIEVHPRLWVGNDDDAMQILDKVVSGRKYATDAGVPNMGLGVWACVSAAKEPWHRRMVGYTGRAAPEGAERYAIRRGRHLALNWVDVSDPGWFRPVELHEAMWHVAAAQRMEIDCLVHCNQGASRSPALALAYLHRHVEDWGVLTFERAEERFRGVYPAYDPTEGVREFIRRYW